jgi:hypothetical protein
MKEEASKQVTSRLSEGLKARKNGGRKREKKAEGRGRRRPSHCA